MRAKIVIVVVFLGVLFLPLVVQRLVGVERAGGADGDGDARRLVVVTPHVEQIREEFGAAFSAWHEREHGEPVVVDWRTPGGTSDIIKQMEAQFESAARAGRIGEGGVVEPGAIGYDVFFGGGSFEHSKMREVRKSANGGRTYRWGQPADFTSEELAELFGENKIGVQQLYDPEQYWIGTALSGFGIVYNKDLLRERGLNEPTSFEHLTDPRYSELIGLTDGRQSGSITTTYDSILNKEGWERGWRILRGMSANARYFASAATKPPVDVSQGDAAAGLAIDFYGRGQAQFVEREDGTSRVGYVDPPGATYIDADPVSILNGAADAELAKRFVRFCLTEEAQALWQFPVVGSRKDTGAMGPRRYELRRMPVRRVMYEKYAEQMTDDVNPFEIATDVEGKGWRSAIGPMMAAFAIDTSEEIRHAWGAMNEVKAAVERGELAAGALAPIEKAFYEFPSHTMRKGTIWWPAQLTSGMSKEAVRELERRKVATFEELAEEIEKASEAGVSGEVVAEWRTLAAQSARHGQEEPVVPFEEETFRAIRNDTDSWRHPVHGRRALIAYTEYFRKQYREVEQMVERMLESVDRGIGMDASMGLNRGEVTQRSRSSQRHSEERVGFRASAALTGLMHALRNSEHFETLRSAHGRARRERTS